MSALDDDNRFDFNLTATWLHEVKSAFIKRELHVGVGDRAHQGPEVRADARHPQLARRLRHAVGRRPARRAAAGARDASQPRLRSQRGATASSRRTRRPATDLRRLARTRPSCVTASCPATDGRQLGHRCPHNRQFARPAGDHSGRADGGVPSAQAQGLRVPGRRHHLGSIQPAARRHQADLDAELRRPAGRVQGQALRPGRTRRGNTAVGPGYHQFVWSTWVSKRFRYFDPYFGAWYNLPVRTNGSPFQKYCGRRRPA